MSGTQAALAVVLVTPERSALLRGTLRRLREQTAHERLEIVLVGPRPETFADLDVAEMSAFAAWSTLAVGPIVEVERALAAGAAAARAPVIALLENHVYPEPQWAAAILRAHEGPWAAVGSVVENANPGTATSWVEHFLSYGFHDSSVPGGEVERPSRNNLCFKSRVLEPFGPALADALARDGGLLEELRRGGARFYRETAARLLHLNVSRLGSMLLLRVHSARASAATRARLERFSPLRRFTYALASPAFPLLRLRALWPRLRARSAELRGVRGFWPTLALAAIVDSLGQAIGFALGAGRSAERAGRFDLDRPPHVSAADRALFAE